MIAVIVAYAQNRVIGKSNDLPWYIPQDLKRFKEITSGHTVIMGRRTYESIFKRLGHALPNRRNIVISSSLKPGDDYEVVSNLDEALHSAKASTKKIFVIGGEQVYNEALGSDVADKIFATEVKKKINGDKFFPKINMTKWREIDRISKGRGDMNYDWVTYERVK